MPSSMITLSTLKPPTSPHLHFPNPHHFRLNPKSQNLNPPNLNLSLNLSHKFSFSITSRDFCRVGCASKDLDNGEDESDARGESTMPDMFRYLSKEAPDPPIRWPYFVALGFMAYTWRAVLWELHNWKKSVAMIMQFLGYLTKLVLALIFHFIGDPVTSLIRGIETALYTIRAFYSGIINYTPIPELTMVIMLTSVILAIAETTVPDSVNSQPYLLTMAGLTGFAAVKGIISEPFFWTLIVGMFGFAWFLKKRDYVSSVLPVAGVFAGVGEPWVRVLAIGSFTALAISHYSSKNQSKRKEGEEGTTKPIRVPTPLLCAAMAIGIRGAAKWAGYRHLTWMIV